MRQPGWMVAKKKLFMQHDLSWENNQWIDVSINCMKSTCNYNFNKINTFLIIIKSACVTNIVDITLCNKKWNI